MWSAILLVTAPVRGPRHLVHNTTAALAAVVDAAAASGRKYHRNAHKHKSRCSLVISLVTHALTLSSYPSLSPTAQHLSLLCRPHTRCALVL